MSFSIETIIQQRKGKVGLFMLYSLCPFHLPDGKVLYGNENEGGKDGDGKRDDEERKKEHVMLSFSLRCSSFRR